MLSERIKPVFWFGTECKHRDDFWIAHLFRLTKDVIEWHGQALNAAAKEGLGRPPLLILRGSEQADRRALLVEAFEDYFPTPARGRIFRQAPRLYYQLRRHALDCDSVGSHRFLQFVGTNAET